MAMALRLDSFPDPVRQELLLSEITGTVAEDDYIGQSVTFLKDFATPSEEELTNFKAEDAFSFEEAEVLVEPGYLSLENGWVRRSDGSLFVACLTDLGEHVTGEMLDWWYCHCDDDDKFRWWHPLHNMKATWDPSFYAAMPFERTRGHYVDHIFILEQEIGGKSRSLHVEFMRPSKVFDVAKFAENNVTACLVAKLHTKDATLGMIGIGHMVHIVREVDGRSELRSRFWLGDEITYPETPDNYYYAQLVQSLANASIFKLFKISFDSGRETYTHCAEEMACLVNFLPRYYEAKNKEMAEFKKNFLSAF